MLVGQEIAVQLNPLASTALPPAGGPTQMKCFCVNGVTTLVLINIQEYIIDLHVCAFTVTIVSHMLSLYINDQVSLLYIQVKVEFPLEANPTNGHSAVHDAPGFNGRIQDEIDTLLLTPVI